MIKLKKVNYFARRSKEKIFDSLDDTRRVWQDKARKPSEIINSKEIRILGLRRSGNHAIINWITKQLSENHVFINHARVMDNPYRNVYRDQKLLAKQPNVKAWRCQDIDWWQKEAKGNFSTKDCLLYSYEDQEIERVAHNSFEKKHDIYLGESKERFDVIIIRDPFNLLASRIKGNKNRPGTRSFDLMQVYSRKMGLKELWIAYAKECLNETNLLTNTKVVINYNNWFLDKSYRQQIALKLGLNFSDRGFNEVSSAGGIGSSFDGKEFQDRASKMDVLSRWKSIVDLHQFIDMSQDRELIEYSQQLFGHIPEMEALFKILNN